MLARLHSWDAAMIAQQLAEYRGEVATSRRWRT
jgi:hypothetical protein